MTPDRSPPSDLVQRLATRAAELGFDLFGITPAVTVEGYHRLVEWIDAGYAAEMDYFADRLPAYRDPGLVLAGVRSVIVLSYPYHTLPRFVRDGNANQRAEGKIARYAWGDVDYHDLIHPLLTDLKSLIRSACPDAEARGVVDTAPLMEREFANLAGLGWAGKNSLLLNKRRGSYFFLACLLTTLDLPPSAPHETAHCGTCTRCLDACPTDAFAAPGVVDSRRCISYLTIEHRGPIAAELRPGIGDWLFGCDICQEVCPWNRRTDSGPSREANERLQPRPGQNPIDLAELLTLNDDAFRARFRRTPLWRARRRGLLRNAAICLGNSGDRSALGLLVSLLADREPLIRGAAAWAASRLGCDTTLLRDRLAIETDPDVRAELESLLS